jgi:predicted ATPase
VQGDHDAIRLFEDRARLARAEFDLAEYLHEVGVICPRLDGMPLAIELAAARVRGLDITEIARRLDDRFSLLTTGSPERGRRKDSLREVAWSYDLLPEHDQCCFRRLGVFADGFTLSQGAVAPTGPRRGRSARRA